MVLDDHVTKRSLDGDELRLELSFEPMASVTYMPLAININKATGARELCALIRSEIERRGRNNIYRLRLFGGKDPEVSFDLSEITDTYI